MNLLKKNKNIIFLIGLITIQLFVYFYNIDKTYQMYILGDEFGYWTNAAYMFGYNWSSVTSHNTYYSWGYSLLLVPLFYISNWKIRYQVALAINITLMIIAFCIQCYIERKLFEKINSKWIYFVNTIISVYSTNIFYAKTTQSESFLYFIYVIVILLLFKVLTTQKKTYYMILGIVSGFIVCVHMRSIGVLLAACITVCIYILKKKEDIQKGLFFLFAFLGVLLILYMVKNMLINDLYQNNVTVAVNNVSGQVSKIRTIMSINGIWLFIRSIMGKIVYLQAATFLLFGWGMVCIINHIYINIKNSVYSERMYIYFFILFSIIFSVIISAIATINRNEIFDITIYGRYNEYLIGPIVGIGLLHLIEHKTSIKKIWIRYCIYAWLFLILCGIYLSDDFNSIKGGYLREANIAAISQFCYNGKEYVYEGWFIVILVKVVLISIVLSISLSNKKNIYTVISLIVVGNIWIINGHSILNKQLIYRQSYSSNSIIANYITEQNIDEVAYYKNINYTYFDDLLPDTLQFMCPNLVINYCNKMGQKRDVTYVLVRNGRDILLVD